MPAQCHTHLGASSVSPPPSLQEIQFQTQTNIAPVIIIADHHHCQSHCHSFSLATHQRTSRACSIHGHSTLPPLQLLTLEFHRALFFIVCQSNTKTRNVAGNKHRNIHRTLSNHSITSKQLGFHFPWNWHSDQEVQSVFLELLRMLYAVVTDAPICFDGRMIVSFVFLLHFVLCVLIFLRPFRPSSSSSRPYRVRRVRPSHRGRRGHPYHHPE